MSCESSSPSPFAQRVAFLLLGASLAGLILAFGPPGHARDLAAQVVTCVAMAVSAVLSVLIFSQVALGGQDRLVEMFPFIQSGALQVSWAFKFDTLSAVMVAVVSICSTMIHIYSVGYMHDDPSVPRFQAYLSLFTFCMLMLVTADNFIQMFFGWEGVGVCSYLLIGFWYDRPSAGAAAIKAFVVNRVGDFGFALGIFATFQLFGSVVFDEVFAATPNQVGATLHFLSWDFNALTLTCLLHADFSLYKNAIVMLLTYLLQVKRNERQAFPLYVAESRRTASIHAA